MWAYLSPVDPIFFLHHANLDRLWDVWTRRQAALGRPTLPEGADLPTWSNEEFLFFSDENGQPVSKTKAGDYSTLNVFGYDYSPGSGEDQVPAAVAALKAGLATQRFDARITAQSLAAGQAASGAVDVPVAALAPAAGAFPPAAEVSLNLGAADEGRRFRVTATPASGGKTLEVGTITMFGHPNHEGPTTFSVALPELSAVAGAAGDVTLDFSVAPLEGAAGESLMERKAKLLGAAAKPSPPPQLAAVRVILPKPEQQ